MKREFTGVFIPAHIWTSKELIPAEKMLLGEIDALSKSRGYCDASRDHFAEWLSCTPPNISYYFEKLERLGFIVIEKTPGKRNKIRVVNERFYINEGVNPVYPTRKPHLPLPVNPIYSTRKPHLPEIKEKYNNKQKEYCAEENPHPIYQVEIFEPVKTETVELPRVKVLMPRYDLKKHPLPELEAQREELVRLYKDPKTPKENLPKIETTGKKVAALIQTEKDIDAAILLLNEKAGFTYRLNTPATRKAIKNRLQEYALPDLALVIEFKCKEWADDERMRQYLRPDTLFNGHFESYYQAALLAKKSPVKSKGEVYQRPKNLIGQ